MINTNKPVVLTIAASDSAGMAGVQMDIKVQTAFDVHSVNAITANTAQNNQTVLSVNCVDATVLKQQLVAVSHYPISMIKVGLIAEISQVKVIADFVADTELPLIFDPVVASTSNYEFFDIKNLPALADALLPYCTLITPNIDEASLLTHLSINSTDDVELAAHSLISLGAQNVLIKGGHLKSNNLCQDFFANEESCFWLSSPRQQTDNCRGTGCALASSIASSLALGYSMYDAVIIGKMAVNQGLRESYSIASDKGPVAIKGFPDRQVDMPVLSQSAEVDFASPRFPECNQPSIGLYPIVERAAWIEKLCDAGVTTVQLRVKDLEGEALENEIKEAINIAENKQCRLFINDYWQIAIKSGAYGVHLGQEDLDTADIKAIYDAGCRLGISTHCHQEVAKALLYKPSYIACGPIYHTNSKIMPWQPQGSKGLSYWRKALDYPLVAIGGIDRTRISEVLNCAVDGVAMISAITQSSEPELVTAEFVELCMSQTELATECVA